MAITHDDCTVSKDWVGVAGRLAVEDEGAVFTGSVLPAGDPSTIPSTIDDPTPRDYTGRSLCRVLYPNNMVCPRGEVLARGGFDPAFVRAAEDNDLCYRWLRAGGRLRYEPELRVWHHGGRTSRQMLDLEATYGYGQGLFYAKHLRRRDPRMLWFFSEDLRGAVKSNLTAVSPPGRERAAARRAFMRGLFAGLREGWRSFG